MANDYQTSALHYYGEHEDRVHNDMPCTPRAHITLEYHAHSKSPWWLHYSEHADVRTPNGVAPMVHRSSGWIKRKDGEVLDTIHLLMRYAERWTDAQPSEFRVFNEK